MVKLYLCLLSYTLCQENIRGSGSIAPLFLTSALDGGEWSASCPCRFTRMERATDTHWIGGWVGPELVWMLWRREKSCTAGNWTQDIQPVARHYTDWAILTPNKQTSWNWVLLVKPPVTQLLKISQHFMEAKGSLSCSQEPSIVPCSNPDHSSPYHPIIFL
jgi:hypothetical protein